MQGHLEIQTTLTAGWKLPQSNISEPTGKACGSQALLNAEEDQS